MNKLFVVLFILSSMQSFSSEPAQFTSQKGSLNCSQQKSLENHLNNNYFKRYTFSDEPVDARYSCTLSYEKMPIYCSLSWDSESTSTGTAALKVLPNGTTIILEDKVIEKP